MRSVQSMDATSTSSATEIPRDVGVLTGRMETGFTDRLTPSEVPEQRVLDTYLNTALDSPASYQAYRRQCEFALF